MDWEKIADKLAEELRTYQEESGHPVSAALDEYDGAKRAQKADFVDVAYPSCREDGPNTFVTEASTLGWAPGFWPLAIRFNDRVLRNAFPRKRNGELECVEFNDGFVKVRVYND